VNVEQLLLESIEESGTIHLTLIDPDFQTPRRAAEIAAMAVEGGTTAIMVGGSVGVGGPKLEYTVREIKNNIDLPVILFPADVGGVCAIADAIFFMSLLNSRNVMYVTTNQALGAPFVKRYEIEPLPMAYIIVEPGGTVGWVGDARPIPADKFNLAEAYALAGKYLGMRWIYLEAGSGASNPVPLKMVSTVKDAINDTKLIVGGGVKTEKQAALLAKAGADAIVTGTAIEHESDVRAKIEGFVQSIRH